VSFHHLDQLATVSSAVTRLTPPARVLATATVAIGAAALPLGAWPYLGALALVSGSMVVAARLPVSLLVRRLAGPFVFVLLASVGVLVLVPGHDLVRIGPVGVSDEGVRRFGFVLGRASVALSAAVVLVSTTTFPELLQALRSLRLPVVVTTALSLGYRLLYLLVDEMERMQNAARARNAGHGATRRRTLLVGITAAGLARALSRGERTHRAMLARGYTGDLPALTPHPWDGYSVSLLVTLIATVGIITAAAFVGAG
jgi:cobalt/nickel transport system permease protein